MEHFKVRAAVREVWAKVLQADISDTTDFFEVGGHSFQAMQIVALLDKEMPKPTPLNLIFDHPRFDEFVSAVTAALAAPV